MSTQKTVSNFSNSAGFMLPFALMATPVSLTLRPDSTATPHHHQTSSNSTLVFAFRRHRRLLVTQSNTPDSRQLEASKTLPQVTAMARITSNHSYRSKQYDMLVYRATNHIISGL